MCSTMCGWAPSTTSTLLQRPTSRPVRAPRAVRVAASGSKEGGEAERPNPGMGLKAVWMGAETLGNVLGAAKAAAGEQQQPSSSSSSPASEGRGPLQRQQAIAAIKADYDENYFVSGVGEMEAYDPSCLFADPFAGFNGVDRFKRNVSNLGGLMRDIDLVITGWEEAEDSLVTSWRFSAILSLPWRPRLAAAGGTTHVFDKETGRVVKHIERWDVEPGRVVRSLIKPSAKIPGNQWEVLMNSVHDGDSKGIWMALSGQVVRVTAPLAGLAALLHLVRGEGMPGVLGAFETAAYLGLAAGVVTEVLKFAGGMQGGETG